MSGSPFQTMGFSEPNRIVVRGKDLCDDLIGKVSFGDMVFLEVVGRLPSAEESMMANAVLVCLTEHGMTPSAIAARLTALGSPGAVQSSIAAGVLGAGDAFLGALEECAVAIQIIRDETEEGSPENEPARVEALVADRLARGDRLPGFGHPVHRDADPRTVRLFALAEQQGTAGRAQRIVTLMQDSLEAAHGRRLPINADGACAAVLLDLGFPPRATRGFAAVARAVGVFGHIIDEHSTPVARGIWDSVERDVPYRDPTPLF